MEREELHRRVGLLQERIKEGKFKVAPHLVSDFETSWSKVEFSDDGLVNPDTIDSRVRMNLNMTAYFEDRKEWKEAVSLQEIQQAYFHNVEHAFGQPYEMMKEAGSNPYQFAGWYTSDPSRVKEAVQMVDDFVPSVLEFWENISEPTWIHLEDSIDSKAVFAGELFPDGSSNVTSSTGIYFDTTILPDPFVKISPLLQFMDEEERSYEILRLGLQVLLYKDLALAETEKAIVAILPDRHQFESTYRDFVYGSAEQDTLIHAGNLFDRQFEEVEELMEFLHHFDDTASLVSALVNPSELVFATEWDGDLTKHIDRYIKEEATKLNISNPGDAVFTNIFSRFSQSNDSFQRSISLNGTPIIRAPTSWLWFNWMLRNNSKSTENIGSQHLHIARALDSTVATEMSWLGDIPPDALIEIRQTGALNEIREMLGGGLSDLIKANPDNFFRTGDQVFDNLQNALAEHEAKIKALRSNKWTFAGKDVGSFLVVGGIEITAAITGLPLYGSLAASSGMSGVIPTAKDLKEKLAQIRKDQSDINNTGIGILFKHKQ